MRLLITLSFALFSGFLLPAQYTLNWAKGMGGTGADQASAATSDAANHVISTGFFYGTVDFDPGPSVFQLTAFGSADIFVQKLDQNGNFLWAVQLGGLQFDKGNDVVCDPAGNIYITGSFQDIADFDPGSGIYALNAGATQTNEAFVVKLDPSGNLVWARQLGGPSSSDEGKGIALDGSGNVITTGAFNNTGDFDPGNGSYNLTPAFYDIYISKLDNAGNFVFAKKMGGPGIEMPYDLSVDGNGNIYSTGYFQNGADFDPGNGSYPLSSAGGTDIYVSKLTSAGLFSYAIGIGSTANDRGYAIYSDNTGNAFVTGNFQGTADFDPGPGVFNLSSAGSTDAFILKLNPQGNMQFALRVGGPSSDKGTAISSDLNGNILCAGDFMSTADFDPSSNVFNMSSAGFNDIYLVQLNANGLFSTALRIGDSLDDAPYAVFVNAANRVHLAGEFSASPDFDPGAGSYVLSSNGSSDAFVMQFNHCQPTNGKSTVTACDSFISFSGQHVWYETGLYYDTLSNAGACDSIVAVTLNIYHSTADTQHIFSCDSLVLHLSDTVITFFHDTSYEETLLNKQKCDSVIYYIIQIGKSSYFEIDTTLYCQKYIGPSGAIYTESGVYYDTLAHGSQDCDSIFKITLQILQGDSSQIYVSSCDRYLSPDGQLIEEDTVFALTYLDHHHCDSVVVYHVEIGHSSYDTLTLSACDSFVVPGSGTVITVPGVYHFNDSLLSSGGCDSIIHINLTLGESNTSKPHYVKACGEYVSPAGQVWTSSGVYADTFASAHGCDSIVVYDLKIFPVSIDTVAVAACDSYMTPTGLLFTQSGFYPDTLTAGNGCDSIVIWDAEITPTPQAQISFWGDTMIATPAGASYQWLFCDNGMSVMPGETGAWFIPVKTGCYAVEVTVNGCVDTSECECYTGLPGLPDKAGPSLHIFPNPSSGTFRISIEGKGRKIGPLRVLDINGREIPVEVECGSGSCRLRLNAARGAYLLEVPVDGQRLRRMILLQ